jgi:hypothetical protein
MEVDRERASKKFRVASGERLPRALVQACWE